MEAHVCLVAFTRRKGELGSGIMMSTRIWDAFHTTVPIEKAYLGHVEFYCLTFDFTLYAGILLMVCVPHPFKGSLWHTI